jgi:hypothetical protein
LIELVFSFNQQPTNVKLVKLIRKVHALKNDRGKQICDGEQAGSEKNDVVI